MKIDAALSRLQRLFLDTAPVIYHVEANPAYQALTDVLFQKINTGDLQAVTSSITLAECLVHPYRDDDLDLARKFRSVIVNGRNTGYRGVDAVVERSAQLRAEYGLRLGDSLQFAVALAAGCDGFLTDDLTLKRVTELQVLVLEELEA